MPTKPNIEATSQKINDLDQTAEKKGMSSKKISSKPDVLFSKDIPKSKEKEIKNLIYHDSLTGLNNRQFFLENLSILDSLDNLPLSIIVGDINCFKLVNDSLGYIYGNKLLKTFAKIFQNTCRPFDIVARIDSNKFVFILPKLEESLAIKMIKMITIRIENDPINLLKSSMTFGCKTKQLVKEDINEIIESAENQMYQQKVNEKNNLVREMIIQIMSTLYDRNHRERLHSQKVSVICEKIAVFLGLDVQERHDLKMAALMHDIGNIYIDESILHKRGKLTRKEWIQIKKHTEVGYRILISSKEFLKIADSILQHHEKWDGTGYPKGLKGKDILLNARVIAIADAYEAMTSVRSYRKKMSKQEAFEEIKRCSGTQFDPKLVRLFINHYSE
ncbi:MAG: diguanylate cyclase [Firmicutes bacterium]|nr:diguanylate cyclase [Bacillota bacterium]